ncbi:MAG TPA: hypoxanthine phosphoribosyltransferase [Pirellulales bacterium]|nr:hypoxanthine phosphoribosyltransferase [Pirellulales bacterium]
MNARTGGNLKILLSEQELRGGVARLADEINTHYREQPLTIIGVLTGSVVLLADLIRLLTMPLRVGVIQARSYRGSATSPGELTIQSDLLPDIRGRQVLVVDDIFDTGQTLLKLAEQLGTLEPASLRLAVLLRKQGRQRVEIKPDYVGFEIPDAFVVGYGLDYQDEYRNLPYVAALEAAELAAGSTT